MGLRQTFQLSGAPLLSLKSTMASVHRCVALEQLERRNAGTIPSFKQRGGGSGRGEGAADTAREIQINGKNKKNVEALRIVKTQ